MVRLGEDLRESRSEFLRLCLRPSIDILSLSVQNLFRRHLTPVQPARPADADGKFSFVFGANAALAMVLPFRRN